MEGDCISRPGCLKGDYICGPGYLEGDHVCGPEYLEGDCVRGLCLSGLGPGVVNWLAQRAAIAAGMPGCLVLSVCTGTNVIWLGRPMANYCFVFVFLILLWVYWVSEGEEGMAWGCGVMMM